MRIWVTAARPRTLPAAIAPVLVGTAAVVATFGSVPRPLGFAAALVASILIQIGTNLANDYSDARRGADTPDRLGPVRVTATGLATPSKVLWAAWIAFGLAILLGLYLAWLAGPVILLVGALSITAGTLYTGGPKPYGYAGLGEGVVFLFFVLVAVNGSYYIQLESIDLGAVGLSITTGLLATAILVINNVRDLESDRRTGKMTLAARFGRSWARGLFKEVLVASLVVLLGTVVLDRDLEGALLGIIGVPFAVRALRAVETRTDGPSLNRALAEMGISLALFGIGASLGMVIF
ncbi:MAG: 1,4-dihydroxy-2-naphthoate polyprenyltransferase [Solirubrobacterales bacterium]